MRTSTYSVWLNSPTGDHIAAIPDFFSLRATQSLNDIGALTLTMPASFPYSYLEGRRDLQLEIWRRDIAGGQTLLTNTIWLVRRHSKSRRGGGMEYSIGAVPLLELLNRRIIYAYAGSAGADKEDPADDVCKALVRENMGADVLDSARDLSTYLTVAADISQAPSVIKKCAYRNLLQTLQEICQTSAALGTQLFFDITYSSYHAFVFRTYTGQLGLDRTDTTGVNTFYASEDSGSLVDPSYEEDYTSEITYVYAGGSGDGAGRVVGTAPTATSVERSRQYASPFNRIEAFSDARNGYTTVAGCEYEAESTLRASRPRKSFSGSLIDTPQSRYGIDWNYGDRVTAVFDNMRSDCLISTIDIDVSGAKETISARLRSVE